jgi:hypothetical protein
MNTINKRNFAFSLRRLVSRVPSATFFLAMIFFALIFFELFNYSTTQYALNDLLGGLTFLFLPWSTILALAFCGIDLAGIARLLSPNPGKTESRETWFLFGAWLIAATMNAILTWWGVTMAMSNHVLDSIHVMDPAVLMRVMPIFVAVIVWLIRILIIGSISYTVDRIMGKGTAQNIPAVSVNHNTVSGNIHPQPQKVPAGFHPIPAPSKPEPVYAPVAVSSMQSTTNPTAHNLPNPRM